MEKGLIENRINNFLGYGNLNSDIWFIGMEEGFHGTLKDLEVRFNKTKDKSVIDLQSDINDVKDHMKWFSPHSNIQKTWGKLIFILLTINSDENIDNNKIKEFQRNKFARLKSNHCSLEFMPLPCRSINKKDWFYDKFGIDYLKTRKEYLKKVMPVRIKLFQHLIKKYSPKIIICYSFSYLKKWKEIVGCNFKKEKNLYYCKRNQTHFFVIPHSTAHGMKNKDWTDIARTIKSMTKNLNPWAIESYLYAYIDANGMRGNSSIKKSYDLGKNHFVDVRINNFSKKPLSNHSLVKTEDFVFSLNFRKGDKPWFRIDNESKKYLHFHKDDFSKHQKLEEKYKVSELISFTFDWARKITNRYFPKNTIKEEKGFVGAT